MLKTVLATLIVLLVPLSGYAAIGTVIGTVDVIRSHDISVSGTWFSVDATVAGSCGLYGDKVLFRIKDDERGRQQLSMVLAAKMSNKSVRVGYDDINLIAGQYCYVRYLDIY